MFMYVFCGNLLIIPHRIPAWCSAVVAMPSVHGEAWAGEGKLPLSVCGELC